MSAPTLYRVVHWLYSTTPGVGKSTLAKGLVTHFGFMIVKKCSVKD